MIGTRFKHAVRIALAAAALVATFAAGPVVGAPTGPAADVNPHAIPGDGGGDDARSPHSPGSLGLVDGLTADLDPHTIPGDGSGESNGAPGHRPG